MKTLADLIRRWETARKQPRMRTDANDVDARDLELRILMAICGTDADGVLCDGRTYTKHERNLVVVGQCPDAATIEVPDED